MNTAADSEQPVVDSDKQARRQARSRAAWSRIVWYLLVPGVLAVVLSLGARWHWALELTTHFQVQYAIALFIPLVLALWLRKKWTAVICAVAFGCVAWQVLPVYLPAEAAGEHGESVRFMLANVHTGNRDYQRLLEFVSAEEPDVIVLLEVDSQWLQGLAELEAEYPQKVLRPRSDNFGLAIYSKLTLEDVETRELADSQVPTVIAKVTIGDDRLTMIATHPLPPVGSLYANSRDQHLVALAQLANGLNVGTPAIVLGDLNTTPWSPRFADLLKSTTLRDSRQGFGIHATWPLAGPLAIPLDHVLVTPNVAVLDRRIGESIGSDHRPVLIDVAIRAPDTQD